MGFIIRFLILFGIFYLIFTNFGTFLMILGGFFLTIALIAYYIKQKIKQNARNFEFRFNQNYQNFNFNDFQNGNFQGNFYNQKSKLDEAKEFFGFTSNNITKDDIKRRYKELAKLYHPDLNGGSDEKMKKLNEYKEILLQAYN